MNKNLDIIIYSNFFELENRVFAFRKKHLFDITNLPTLVNLKEMETKKCRFCGNEYPKTDIYFRKNGNSFRSKCKKCLNKNLPKKTDDEKKQIKKISYKLWQEKNRIKRNEKQKEYRIKNIEKYKDRSLKYNRKISQNLTDDYILSLLCKRSRIQKEVITKETIETKKLLIILKREINYGQAKGLKF
jgi:hypothetical protein